MRGEDALRKKPETKVVESSRMSTKRTSVFFWNHGPSFVQRVPPHSDSERS